MFVWPSLLWYGFKDTLEAHSLDLPRDFTVWEGTVLLPALFWVLKKLVAGEGAAVDFSIFVFPSSGKFSVGKHSFKEFGAL